MTTNKQDLLEPLYRFKAATEPESGIWYGTRGNRNADIMIVGESWGAEERKMNLPFMGKSGQLLEILLREANISLNDCFFTNVVSINPRGNNMATLFYHTKVAEVEGRQMYNRLYPKDEVLYHRKRLYNQILEVKPKLVIGLGNYTLWALTEDCFDTKIEEGRLVPTGISNYRGSQLYTDIVKVPFLPTYHPAATFRTYAWRAMIRHDFRRRIPIALSNYPPEPVASKEIQILKPDRLDWEEPERKYGVRPDFCTVTTTLRHFINCADIRRADNNPKLKIAVDIETRGNYIACIGFAWSKHEALCIPILTADRGKKSGYWVPEEEFEITLLLRELLTHAWVKVIGQNFSFDAQYIYSQMFFLPSVADDTMLKHHTIFPGGGDPTKGTGPQGLVQKSLNHLSSLYCDHHKYWKDEGKTWEVGMPEEDLWAYNCRDCCVTYEVNEKLDEVLKKFNLESQYRFQMDQLNKLAIPMMLRGVNIDLKTRNSMTLELLDAIAKYETAINPMVPKYMLPETKKGAAPWYRSPKQLAHLFYDELGIKPVYGPSGSPTTGKKALPILAKREPIIKPIIDAISTLRSLNVFYGTFLSAELDVDNRMRCSYNVAGTETFRWSSSTNVFGRGTNLQNIPKDSVERTMAGVRFPDVRKLFVPDNGYILIDADLAGADAQVVAWETGEEELKDALRKGTKIHSMVSKKLYGTDEQPHYDMCKRRIHATNYGGGARTLHLTLAGLYGITHTSEKIEQDFQSWWFSRYPGVKDWHERVKVSLGKRRGVANKFGNRVVFQDRIDQVFTQALAWIPQSTVALITSRGMLAIKEKFSFIEILMQVHDSVVFQIPKRERKHLEEIKATLNSITVPYDDPLRIPWTLEVSNKSWGGVEG